MALSAIDGHFMWLALVVRAGLRDGSSCCVAGVAFCAIGGHFVPLSLAAVGAWCHRRGSFCLTGGTYGTGLALVTRLICVTTLAGVDLVPLMVSLCGRHGAWCRQRSLCLAVALMALCWLWWCALVCVTAILCVASVA